jgi:hypothetical protein
MYRAHNYITYLWNRQTSIVEFSTHYDNALPIDLQGAIVPFNDGLKTIFGSKDPQQHSEDTEDELEEPHDEIQLRDRTCRPWVQSYIGLILYDIDAPKASGTTDRPLSIAQVSHQPCCWLINLPSIQWVRRMWAPPRIICKDACGAAWANIVPNAEK